MDDLKWNADGLIPTIVQDAETGQTHFWSRTRRELWHKGATSGNVQEVVGIWADCDGDTLLVKVHPAGPACHTGEVSCFFRRLGHGESD